MTLVKVYTDVGGIKPVHLIAKIFEVRDNIYVIRYLSPTDETKGNKVIYRYEDETYEIGDESISEYIDTADEEDVGFKKIPGEDGFIKVSTSTSSTSDSDYEEEDEDDEDDSEYSCVSEGDDEEYWGSEE